MFKGGRQVRPFFSSFFRTSTSNPTAHLPSRSNYRVDLILRAKEDYYHSKYSLKKSGSLSRT